MVDASMITGVLGSAKLSASDITNLVSEKSPIPVPEGVVQGILDQLVEQGKINKSEENGQIVYSM